MSRLTPLLGLFFAGCSAASAESVALNFVRGVQAGQSERAIDALCPSARQQLAAAAVQGETTPGALIARLAAIDTPRTVVGTRSVAGVGRQDVHIRFSQGPEQKITLRQLAGRRWCVMMND
jgi:hypothetical protein